MRKKNPCPHCGFKSQGCSRSSALRSVWCHTLRVRVADTGQAFMWGEADKWYTDDYQTSRASKRRHRMRVAAI